MALYGTVRVCRSLYGGLWAVGDCMGVCGL